MQSAWSSCHLHAGRTDMIQGSRKLACSILRRPTEDLRILPAASIFLGSAIARHVGLAPCLYESLNGKIGNDLRRCQNFARRWAGFVSLLEPPLNTLSIVGLSCLNEQDWISVQIFRYGTTQFLGWLCVHADQ